LRASSTSAAVPEALSFAPGPVPVLSRWAMTTIAARDWPAATAHSLRSVSSPSPATCSRHASLVTGNPYGAIWSRNQRAARTELAPFGERSGNDPAKSAASLVAAAPSKFGGRSGAGSEPGRTTLKARTTSGRRTTRKVLR
jgi:hypothetical protein